MVITFLALLTLVAVFASAIPSQPALLLPNSTAFTFPTDLSTRCIDVPLEHRLRIHDCKTAMAQLPADEEGDVYIDPYTKQYSYPVFSRTSSEERHRLPVTIESGSCNVEVRLAPAAYVDTSSWRIIALRVGNVIRKCVDEGQGSGGHTVTGEEKDIEIILYSPHVPPPTEILPMARNGSVAII